MGIFGWSLPPGCRTLPGEEEHAYEVRIDGVQYAWDEHDNVYRQDAKHPDARDDGYVLIGTLAWPDDPDADPRVVLHKFVNTRWEAFCRRTEDPKLRFIEGLLTQRGIPHRRNGRSVHAPILQVPEEHLDAAWGMLSEDIFGDGQRLDDIPDDDSVWSNT